jgi:hypothetical protein
MMVDKGIMQQVRELLMEGKSSQEVIALGYAPGSVYKVQRQLRFNSRDKQPVSAQPGPEIHVSVVDTEALTRLEAENAELGTKMAELLQEVEEVTSLQHQLAQLQRLCEEWVTKVGQSQEEGSQYAQKQQHRIETLEQQVEGPNEVIYLLGLLVYHLDVHHRQQIHRWPPEPADRDLQPSDQGYHALLLWLRQWLAEAVADIKRRQRFGLSTGFKGLGPNVHPQQLLRHQSYLNRPSPK